MCHSLHSWIKLRQGSLSSFASESKRRKSQGSSLLWTRKLSHATLTHRRLLLMCCSRLTMSSASPIMKHFLQSTLSSKQRYTASMLEPQRKLKTVHKNRDELVDTNQEVATQRHFEFESLSEQPTISAASMLQVPPVITQNSLERMYSSVVSHSGCSQSTIQTIVCRWRKSLVISEIYKKVEHCLNQLDNPFSKFNTDEETKI